MIATLAKRAEALEAAFWAQAERADIPVDDESVEFFVSVSPLGDKLFDKWLMGDSEAARTYKRMEQIEAALPQIHPAFLPDEHEAFRRMQWAWYNRAEYRELYVKTWQRFMSEVAPIYDVKLMGLVGVSLLLYEKEIDEWIAQREYIGSPTSREEMACNQIELWKISERIRYDAGYPQDKNAQDELWRQTCIEYLDYCYGREITEEELSLEWQMWRQVREDMAAGKSASESEAALYLREVDERYPRKSGLRTYLPGEVTKF